MGYASRWSFHWWSERKARYVSPAERVGRALPATQASCVHDLPWRTMSDLRGCRSLPAGDRPQGIIKTLGLSRAGALLQKCGGMRWLVLRGWIDGFRQTGVAQT